MPFQSNIRVKNTIKIVCEEEFEELKKINEKDWNSIRNVLNELSNPDFYYKYTKAEPFLDCTELSGIQESRIGKFKMNEKEIVLSLYMYENILNMNAFHIGSSTKTGKPLSGPPKSQTTIKKTGVVIPILKATVKYVITPTSVIDSLVNIVTDE